MRRVFMTLVTLLVVLPLMAQTAQPTADEIVARYIEAAGGMAAIQAIHTVRMTGKFIGGGGFEAPVSQENKRPGKVREEFTQQGLTGINAYDGTTGWKIEPWSGKKDVESLSEEELKSIIEDADFDGPLVNYRAKNNTITYEGIEPIEGTDTYKLKVTAPGSDVRYFYLDTDTAMPIRVEIHRLVRGSERVFESTLGAYKRVGGWYFPHSVEINLKGRANRQKFAYSRIEANVPLSDSRFARPSSAGASGTAPQLPDASDTAARGSQLEPVAGLKPEASAAAAREAASGPASGGAPAGGSPAGSVGGNTSHPSGPARFDSETISGLGARNIGSAAMSGRIAAIDAVRESGRLTVYIGSASGGVWKSVNSGTTYKPVFDKAGTQSIGAVAIDPTTPKTVWVGTGESWTRNSVSVGDGIYKSTDGGDNWTNMGLHNSERIARIAIDPTDGNTVYACVPGKLWSDSEDRGVYKTADGGRSWTRVLSGTNLSTGCSMLSLDRQNPKTLYAGMWDFRRRGWTFRSGGESAAMPSGSGLFKSVDGGASWQELSGSSSTSASGLPPKPWGRVAVTVAPSNPNIVYAMIEAVAPKNGLYRSEDGGKSWQARDRSQLMIWRPFYFANLIVDPKDPNKIYKPDLGLIASSDGGATFSNITSGAHGDFHDVWIDPADSEHVIAGDDGGVWYSYDAGNRWWKAENLPVSQFYHVSVDMERPYNVYGGLQDNSAWVGASSYPGGIANSQWENMYGGDGFFMFADPSDPTFIYAEAQGGDIARINRKTHEIRPIKPLPQYKEGKLRFNWNTPIFVSPTGTLYIGSQFLHRSTDHGQTWQRISPDLTTNDPQKQRQEESGGVTIDNSYAEMHTTIYAIAESPKGSDLLWAGTDDGNLQVTRDAGKNWTNVVRNVPGLPGNAWVTSIEPGHFEAGTAYVTFDRHTFGDMQPYVYRTADYGQTWTPLVASGGPVRGYAHVVKEDLVNPSLLFLGTEMGLWVSIDGGQQWAQYKGGELPNVAVRDLAIHPRDNDLVIATHGRGIWIVDNITPLRALSPPVLASDVTLISSGPVVQRMAAFGGWANGDAEFAGPNPPGDAVITYYQRGRHVFGDLLMEVKDATGKVVGTIPASGRRGLNRVTWSMRLSPPRIPTAASSADGGDTGPRLLPGSYNVTLTNDGRPYSMPLEVVPDPRSTATAEERRAELDLATRIYEQLGNMTYVVDRVNGIRQALDARVAKLTPGDPLAGRLRGASSQIDAIRKRIVATTEGGAITGEERLREHLASVYGNVVGYEGRPSQTEVESADALTRELSDVSSELDQWIMRDLPPINEALAGKKLPKIDPLTRARWQATTPGGGATQSNEMARRPWERD
jgi:photosystem II stability/assembly factor-like uncharacterized protein